MKLYVAALLATLILSPPVLCDTGVDRAISEVAPDEFDVTLTINNTTICGIVETLQDGVTYLGTTHPAGQVRVSGDEIAFAVTDETSVTYQVRSSASGQPDDITGIWIDLLSDESGMVGGGEIRVPAHNPNPTQTPQSEHDTPGFVAVSLILMVLAAYMTGRRRI
ncbi:MAG: hypothetical protein U9N09_05735 [Euryarchaeota archaeon]|nr:hypothetical protein [Euryarchaeota archaeon]